MNAVGRAIERVEEIAADVQALKGKIGIGKKREELVAAIGPGPKRAAGWPGREQSGECEMTENRVYPKAGGVPGCLPGATWRRLGGEICTDLRPRPGVESGA